MTTAPVRLRMLAAGAGTLLGLDALVGCAPNASQPAPSPTPTASSSPASELVGTTWTGIDTDGDPWTFEFQDDGTVAFTFLESSYDDAGDTWAHEGDEVVIHIEFVDGPVDISAVYAGLDAPMEATAAYEGGGFAMTLTRD
ncbi:hypothetical protein H4J02_08780 [Protaetiibacter sp. SSC-01]|uniref:hypothetical protein n=1 Tax=Protaetiibacter sp. SSC-01 TaxID=2759943 RepID=UPI0016572254|nr:hypothetical protein [Protaetiibacter sp. SSC-01]QNO36600.1 hypothetical protein H4J02_08780 [Protaetiibacter sp. SSC-01]